MAPKYAKDQPTGFDNHLKNIAIVGVSHFQNLIAKHRTDMK